MPDIRLEGEAHLRLAHSDDSKGLSRLEARCFPEDQYGEHILSQSQFNHLIKRGNALTIIYENDKTILGYALILFNKRFSNVRLYSIAVSPEAQGQGIGTVLLEASERIAIRAEAKKLLLEIREDNHSSLQRYLRLRYNVTKTIKDYFPGGISAIKMSVSVPDILKSRYPDEKQIH